MKFFLFAVIVMAGSPAWAEAAPGAASGGLMSFVPLVAILGIFYFLLIRPQQKQARQHRRMVDELKRGDRILTQGGIYGTVQAVKGKVIEVKISDDTKVLIAKSYVAQVVQGDPANELEPAVNGAAKA